MSTARLRALLPCLVASLVLTACPDPTSTSSGPGEAPQAGGERPGPGAGGPGMGAPPEGSRPSHSGFDVAAGQGVLLSGSFSYAGTKTGSYRIDFLSLPEGSPPVLLHAMTLEAPGAWSVEAPKDLGDVYVVAFIDQSDDGPTTGDPAARLADAIKVADQPLSGLDLVLVDDPDLGELTPGPGGTPDGSGPPPTPGKGPEGGAEGAPPTGGDAPPAEPPPAGE